MSLKPFLLSAAMLVSVAAAGQRLVPGQVAVSASCLWGLSPVPSGGEAGVSFIRSGYCIPVYLSVETCKYDYTSAASDSYASAADYVVRRTDIMASGGARWLVCGTRSRSFNLWLGASAAMGVRVRGVLEYVEPVDRVPSCSFLWGFNPEVVAELFVSPTVSLSLLADPALRFAVRPSSCSSDSSEPWFVPRFGLKVTACFFTGH